jgi:hypothetical protein
VMMARTAAIQALEGFATRWGTIFPAAVLLGTCARQDAMEGTFTFSTRARRQRPHLRRLRAQLRQLVLGHALQICVLTEKADVKSVTIAAVAARRRRCRRSDRHFHQTFAGVHKLMVIISRSSMETRPYVIIRPKLSINVQLHLTATVLHRRVMFAMACTG